MSRPNRCRKKTRMSDPTDELQECESEDNIVVDLTSTYDILT